MSGKPSEDFIYLRSAEHLNFFETHYHDFAKLIVLFFFEKKKKLLEVYRANKLKESHGC